MDINPNVLPRIVIDLSKSKCFELIPDNSINVIIFHTLEIENNPSIGDETHCIIKKKESYGLVDPMRNQ